MNNNGKTAALVSGGIVYLGVIIVGVVLSIEFIVGIMPADAYFARSLLTVGVVLVGLNSVALPLALHFWAVAGLHRYTAIALYALDMGILGVNMVTSFSTLMGMPPAWVMQYEPYAVSMFVFALATWGVLFITDPGERAKIKRAAAEEDFRMKAYSKAVEWLDSVEGHAAIEKAAEGLLPEMFDSESLKKTPPKWGGTGKPAPVAPADMNVLHSEADAVNFHKPVSPK